MKIALKLQWVISYFFVGNLRYFVPVQVFSKRQQRGGNFLLSLHFAKVLKRNGQLVLRYLL